MQSHFFVVPSVCRALRNFFDIINGIQPAGRLGMAGRHLVSKVYVVIEISDFIHVDIYHYIKKKPKQVDRDDPIIKN